MQTIGLALFNILKLEKHGKCSGLVPSGSVWSADYPLKKQSL